MDTLTANVNGLPKGEWTLGPEFEAGQISTHLLSTFSRYCPGSVFFASR